MIDIESMSYEELMALNERIVDRLNHLDTIESIEAMSSLNIGSKVSFDSNKGRQTGRVVKLNTKTVRVISEDGRNWKVSPYLLTKIEESKQANVVKISGKKKGCR